MGSRLNMSNAVRSVKKFDKYKFLSLFELFKIKMKVNFISFLITHYDIRFKKNMNFAQLILDV
jgi:hypothetical protein